MKSRYVVPIAVVVVVAGASLAVWWLRAPNRVIVRNSSGVRVSGIVLVLRDFHGEWSLKKSIARLEPGDSITIRHGKNDTTAELRYVIRGASHQHEEQYIDLWTGEGWVFDIQADGTVASGYDYPMSK